MGRKAFCLGCYTKISKSNSFISNRNLQVCCKITVLEDLRSLVDPAPWFTDNVFFCVLTWEKEGGPNL